MIAFANDKFYNFLTVLESRAGFNPVEKFLQRTTENKAKLRMVILAFFGKFFHNLIVIREAFNSYFMIPSILPKTS